MGIGRLWYASKLLVIIAGICWCVAICRRWREDVATLRESQEPVDRYVVLGYWAATAIVAAWLVAWGVPYLAAYFRMLTNW